MTSAARSRVVIVGGGFGGLYLAKSLKRVAVNVTLVDRRNFHLFQPLLYQVATGGLSPANIAAPLRSILQRQRNTRVLLGEVVGFDARQNFVKLADGELPFDTLVVAAGAANSYFGNDRWQPIAPGLKTLEDAMEIRRRILSAFEAAERESDRSRVREWLTFVVVGGGPTGVELAGALAEIARHTLRNEFRAIDPADATILLVEGSDRVLGTYPPELSAKAQKSLERLGVTVRCSCRVSEIASEQVSLTTAHGSEEVRTRTVLWGAGVKASPLGKTLADATGCMLDRTGRVIVEPDCSIRSADGKALSSIFVIGDLAAMKDGQGRPLPGTAPVAMQQGRFVASIIASRAAGRKEQGAAFQYFDKGSLATIGRASAVADIGGMRLSGIFAWLTWLFVHILFLVEFQNRILVMMQWAWNYFTWDRAARLITGNSDGSSPAQKNSAL